LVSTKKAPAVIYLRSPTMMSSRDEPFAQLGEICPMMAYLLTLLMGSEVHL
jgi:hypothetical protein